MKTTGVLYHKHLSKSQNHTKNLPGVSDTSNISGELSWEWAISSRLEACLPKIPSPPFFLFLKYCLVFYYLIISLPSILSPHPSLSHRNTSLLPHVTVCVTNRVQTGLSAWARVGGYLLECGQFVCHWRKWHPFLEPPLIKSPLRERAGPH